MSHQPVQLIPGTVVEALDWAIGRPYASYRLILALDDLQPDGHVILIGTWRQRFTPEQVHARLAELGHAQQVPA